MVKRKKTNKLVNSNCKKATYKRKYKSKKRGQLKLRNGKPYCIKPNRSSKYINKLRRGTNKKSKKNSRINEVLAGEVDSNRESSENTLGKKRIDQIKGIITKYEGKYGKKPDYVPIKQEIEKDIGTLTQEEKNYIRNYIKPKSIKIDEMTGKSHIINTKFPINVIQLKELLNKYHGVNGDYKLFKKKK